MSISFKIKDGMCSQYDTPTLFFEVLSDSLVVARVQLDDWDDRHDLMKLVRKVEEEISEWEEKQYDV